MKVLGHGGRGRAIANLPTSRQSSHRAGFQHRHRWISSRTSVEERGKRRRRWSKAASSSEQGGVVEGERGSGIERPKSFDVSRRWIGAPYGRYWTFTFIHTFSSVLPSPFLMQASPSNLAERAHRSLAAALISAAATTQSAIQHWLPQHAVLLPPVPFGHHTIRKKSCAALHQA
jgi:hypothetical protein